jgi:hypothetical protein
MPQSLSEVILNIIFSTKNRESWLDSNVQPRPATAGLMWPQSAAILARSLSAPVV